MNYSKFLCYTGVLCSFFGHNLASASSRFCFDVPSLPFFEPINFIDQNSSTKQTTQDQVSSVKPQMTRLEKMQLGLQKEYDKLLSDLTGKMKYLDPQTIDDLDKEYPNLCIKYNDDWKDYPENLRKEISTIGQSAGKYYKLTSESSEKVYFAKSGNSFRNKAFTISALREGILGLKLLIEFFTMYNDNAESKELEIFEHIARPFLIKNDKKEYVVMSHFCGDGYETLKEISDSFSIPNSTSEASSPNSENSSAFTKNLIPDFNNLNTLKFDLNSAKITAENLCKIIKMMHNELQLTHNNLHAGNILIKFEESKKNSTNKDKKIENFMLIDFCKTSSSQSNEYDFEKLKELVDEFLTSSTNINSWEDEAEDIDEVISYIQLYGSNQGANVHSEARSQAGSEMPSAQE